MTRPLTRPDVNTRAAALERRVAMLERRYDPELQDFESSEGCLPPPGSIVRPSYENRSGNPPKIDSVRFPGGVIAARLGAFCSSDVASQPTKGNGPSRNASAIQSDGAFNSGNIGTSFDDSLNPVAWVFRPVEDFGCTPGVMYGIFYSFLYNKDGSANDIHIESRSSNTLAAADPDQFWNGGSRHPNSGSTPSTLEWNDPTNQALFFPELPYFGMHPVGGDTYYGDWPLQGGGAGGPGLSFAAGETITVKAWIDGGGGAGAELYLDHLVFMPTYPLGITDLADIGDEIANFQSSALTAYGYVPTSAPASITNPTDNGSWFGGGDTVADTQVLPHVYDPAMHFTIVSHDESDIAGLYTGTGGVHIYIMCRAHNNAGSYSHTITHPKAHLSVFSGMNMLSDINADEAGAWCWAYAGVMPLGDGPQQSVMVIQWLSDDENFWGVGGTFGGTAPDECRSTFIAYLPQSPCEVTANAESL